jgi:hypothetical protein
MICRSHTTKSQENKGSKKAQMKEPFLDAMKFGLPLLLGKKNKKLENLRTIFFEMSRNL